MAAAAQAFLITVLAGAGLVKLVEHDAFLRTLAGLPWLPVRLARVSARAVPLLELTLASLLVVVPRVGAAASLATLVAFTGVVGGELAAGRRFRCGCFGGAGIRAVGANTLLRNALLLTGGIVLLAAPYSFGAPASLSGFGLGMLLLLSEIGAETLALGRQS